MTLVRPFPARIVKEEWAAQVVCPMHDALTPEARATLLADHPLSYLHVTRSVLDMPGASWDELGAANAAGLERLLAAGVYSDLGEPAMYVYRVSRGPEVHTGIVCELDVAAFMDGRVLGHESVQPQRVEALVHHFGAVPTRSELVTVMYAKDAAVGDVVNATTARPPLLRLTDDTGVDQSVWRIDDEHLPVLAERLSARRHYIADGHHRVAATVQRWREHGSPRGGAVLSVLYSDDQMHLLSFHRRVLGPVDSEPLLAALAQTFALEQVAAPHIEPGGFGARLAGAWHVLRPHDPWLTAGAGAAGLDVAALDDRVLRPLLGVASGDPRVQYVSERAGIDGAVGEVDADGGALFLLAAPSLAQLVEVAERGEVMPQKSTYIEPKPRAGVFLRPRQGPVDPHDLPHSAPLPPS